MTKENKSKNINTSLVLGIVVIMLQLCVIGGLIFSQQLVVNTGLKTYLELEPLDPRDPFKGDYVTLNYKISNLTYYNSRPDSDPKIGQEINVPLYLSSYSPIEKNIWQASSVYQNDLDLNRSNNYFDQSNNRYIRGEIIGINLVQDCDLEKNVVKNYQTASLSEGDIINNNEQSQQDNQTSQSIKPRKQENCYQKEYELDVKYGIETYYIPESSGRSIPRFEKGYGVVYIDRQGKAILGEVFLDDKKWP